MPRKIKSICNHNGCRCKCIGRWCEKHLADHKPWTGGRPRGTSTQRGYGASWQRLRASILIRDKGLCVPCRAAGRVTAATEVDHVTPKACGGDDDVDNLQAHLPGLSSS